MGLFLENRELLTWRHSDKTVNNLPYQGYRFWSAVL